MQNEMRSSKLQLLVHQSGATRAALSSIHSGYRDSIGDSIMFCFNNLSSYKCGDMCYVVQIHFLRKQYFKQNKRLTKINMKTYKL